MSEIYAELTLYFGYVPSQGVREGRYVYPPYNEREKEVFFRAMQYVQRFLQPNNLDWAVSLGFDTFVKTARDAEELVKFAQENIRDAESRIELVDSMHGVLRFYRKIRFVGLTIDEQQELIEQLKNSEYKPENREIRDLEWVLGTCKTEKDKEYIKRKLEESIDKAWTDALKFY